MPRLDQLLAHRRLFTSREKARRAVMAGRVSVDGRVVDKPGTAVDDNAELEVAGPREPYVSRGGRKLAAALDRFRVDPSGMTCMDVGSSTGGFTDCLLQRGAHRVYAVDVGRGQLDHALRQDPRVVVMEGVNARYLEPDAISEPCHLITVDVSFISLVKIVPALLPFLARPGRLLVLIKPQFEVGKKQVGRKGVITDLTLRRRVIQERVDDLISLGLTLVGIVDCDVPGAKGNLEAFGLFGWSA